MNFPYTKSQPADVTLLYAARGIRGFGDGFAVIILPAYLYGDRLQPVPDRDRGDRRAARLRRC